MTSGRSSEKRTEGTFGPDFSGEEDADLEPEVDCSEDMMDDVGLLMKIQEERRNEEKFIRGRN